MNIYIVPVCYFLHNDVDNILIIFKLKLLCTVSAVMLGKIRSKLTFSSSCRWTANFSMDLGRKICLNDTAVPVYKWRWYHNYNDESWKTPSKYKTHRLAKIWLIWVVNVLVFLSVLTNTRLYGCRSWGKSRRMLIVIVISIPQKI